MARMEETHKGHSVVFEDDDTGVTLTVDDSEVELRIDDHGPETLYSHRDGYRSFEDPIELARELIDEGVVP